MKNLTYKNINCKFTFENVCSQLTNFWTNEVIRYNKAHIWVNKGKVWITITVVNQNNRSFTLIKKFAV
jgi:hypothetical protein